MNKGGANESKDRAAWEAAAAWLERRKELSEEEMRQFESWLHASAENARAYAAMRQTMLDVALLDVCAALQDRPAPAPAPRTFSVLAGGLRRIRQAFAMPARLSWAAAGTAAFCAVLLAVGLLPVFRSHARLAQQYITALGERADYRLSDHSTISLNADTEVTVRFSGQSRELRMARGEAAFTVAKDPERQIGRAHV